MNRGLWIVASLFTVLLLTAGVFVFIIQPVLQGEDVALPSLQREGPVYAFSAITTNLNEAERRMYIQVVPELKLSNRHVLRELEAKSGAVQDVILAILRSKQYADVQGRAGMENLAEEIRQSLNQYLERGSVEYVYFREFIVQ